MADLITLKRIALLHPKKRDEVINNIVILNKKGIDIRIIEGFRTFAKQDAYYYQDKLPLDQVNTLRLKAQLPIFTDPKQLVWASNSKGGQSYHCYGLAFDFCLYHKDGTISFNMKEDINNDNSSDWMQVVELFQKSGWTWGNVFHDNDHLESTNGYTWQQLLALKNEGKVDAQGYPLI